MIKFLLKGLIRDRSRSTFPVLIVTAGAFLTVLLYSWMAGALGDMLSTSARFDTGHVKIMTRAYEELSDQMPNDLALLGINGLIKQQKIDENNMVWTPRIRFGGLLDVPDARGETREQAPVTGLGIDLSERSPEMEILNLSDGLVRGNLPKNENEILISEDFFRKLELGIGDTVTIIGSTMNGAMAMHNFTIAGTVRFGITMLDRSTIIADIRDVQVALDMPESAGEILGYAKDMFYSNEEMLKVTERFNKRFSKRDDEFSPVMLSLSQQGGIAEHLEMGVIAGRIMIIIFAFAMSIVLWNSGLMNGIRRYGEIGLRLAMGEVKGSIYRKMILESIVTGFIGACIGTLLGLAVSFYMQKHGFDFSEMMQKSTVMMPNVIRARVTGMSYIIGFLPGLIASVVGTMFAGIGIYRRRTSQLFKELEV